MRHISTFTTNVSQLQCSSILKVWVYIIAQDEPIMYRYTPLFSGREELVLWTAPGVLTLGTVALYWAQVQLSLLPTPSLACSRTAFNVLGPSTLATFCVDEKFSCCSLFSHFVHGDSRLTMNWIGGQMCSGTVQSHLIKHLTLRPNGPGNHGSLKQPNFLLPW